MIVFSESAGRVVQLKDAAAQARVQFLERMDPELRFETHSAIITSVTLSQQSNVQFMHALGQHVHIYVFGDRIGQLTVGGLAFQNPCGSRQEAGGVKVLQWYKQNRVSRRQSALRLTLGSAVNQLSPTVLEGFAVGFTENVVDPDSQLVNWTVSMATLPDDDA